MKKFLVTFSFLLFSLQVKAAETYRLDPNHTNISWSANHFGFSNPSGKFTKAEGVIMVDENNPDQSSVEVTVNTNFISTGIDKFDEHLRSADFFDIGRFSTAKFVSSEVVKTSRNTAKITGNLTILGVTKITSFEAKINKIGMNPVNQRKTIGISATTTVKRSDFNMIYGLPGISDNVKLTIEAEASLEASDSKIAAKNSEQIDSGNPKWKIIPEQSKIEFKATQNNNSINGSFKKFDGQINFDKNAQFGNVASIKVDTTSVHMSFSDAIETLKGSAWLAVANFPEATLTAVKFVPTSDKEFVSQGQLKIKSKTIPIKFNFKFSEYNKSDATAIGSFKIKRSDFDVGNPDVEKANGVEDEVEVTFQIKAQRTN